MEFQPYKFFKTEIVNKNTTGPIPLTRNSCLLRLHSLTFSPEEARLQLRLKIEFIEGIKIAPVEFPFSRLFNNPVHRETLFFKSEVYGYTDIELPAGPKKVKYSVISLDETLNFEVALNCMYIKHTDKLPERFKLEDFDALKINNVIQELCDRCIEAEDMPEIWASAYSELFQEIQKIINKRFNHCDLPDELIEFRRITKWVR